MSGPEPEALQSWANSHGLAWQSEDTLPPVTERLRLGVGVGEHRSGLRTVTDRGFVTTEGRTKRPERQTLGVAEGQLPGGLTGKLGHHVYLTDRGRTQAEGDHRYIATCNTVVYAELPFKARPVFHLEAVEARESDIKVGFQVGEDGDGELEGPLDGVVPAPQGIEDAGGVRWITFPAESPERIRRFGSGATRFLDGLPVDRIEVEYECGKLAVWIKGLAVTDPATLDQLCRFASGLASGLAETTESTPALELGEALPLPEPDPRERWVRAGADLVRWEEPPVSVIAAQERYKEDVKSQAARTGWKVYAIVGIAIFIFSIIFALASLAVTLLTDEVPRAIGITIAAISVAGGALAANRLGLAAGQGAMNDRIDSSSIPWGIEAFARGYAEAAGLIREDHEELRRRLEVPFNGRAQMAWQGELSPGVTGHLSSWIDATGTPEPPTFYLLAVTPATGAAPPAGFQLIEQDGRRLTWQEVTSVERADYRLDQLRQAVAD